MNSSEGSVATAGRETPRHHSVTSGAVLALAAAPLGLAYDSWAQLASVATWAHVVAVVSALLACLGGAMLTERTRLGRWAATLSIIGGAGLAAPRLIVSPLLALATLLALTASLVVLWKVGAPIIEFSRARERKLYEGQARGATLAALLSWSFAALSSVSVGASTLVVGWAMLVSGVLALEWGVRNVRSAPRRGGLVLLSLCVAFVSVFIWWGDWWWVVSAFLVPTASTTVVIRGTPLMDVEDVSWWEPLLGHPERLFVGTFAALCTGGALLLALPQSASSGRSIGFVDALFTSTSAVCVTGLIVLDTPVAFSGFGQALILLLIQVGGLGIMTFSTVALWALGRRMSLRHEGAVASLISTQDRGRLFATAKRILQFTLGVEAGGAALLTLGFLAHGDSLGVALWRAMFTSVSAFCNAGFALQSDSLIPYQNSPYVLHVVGVLIVLGGLAPLTVFSIPRIVRRSARPYSAQAGLAFATSVVLLVLGFVFFAVFEWNDSLAGLSSPDKLHNAWFQSVTLRTAGFNSVDLVATRSVTLAPMLLWMFIGGNPGGTAGGVKTTTVSVLVLSTVQGIRGQWTLETFGKRISERTRAKAAVVVTIAVFTAFIALLAVLLTQKIPAHLAVFEVVSALGTVGLSIGGTNMLDGIGKAIIIACMFVGRVGGLTLLMFLRNRRTLPALGRPEEEVDVG